MGNKSSGGYPPCAQRTQVIAAECSEGSLIRLPENAMIVKAWYGKESGGHGKDITKKAIAMHAPKCAQQYPIHASNEFWGDPWLNAKKKLVVHYTIPDGLVVPEPNGSVKTYKAKQNERIIIPEDCWVMKAEYGKEGVAYQKIVTKKIRDHCVRTKCAPFLVSNKTLGDMLNMTRDRRLAVTVSEPIKVYTKGVATVVAPAQAVCVAILKEGEAVPLSNAAVVAVPIAATSVAAVPVKAVPISATPVAAVPVKAVPVAATSVAAVPIKAVPISATPVAAVPVKATPVSATPVAAVPVTATPVSAAPVAAVPVMATPVSATPVAAVPVRATPVRATPVLSNVVRATPVVASIVASAPSAPEPEPSAPTEKETAMGN